MKVLGYINKRGEKISPETKSRVIIFSQSVLITLTPSSKGSMFFLLYRMPNDSSVHYVIYNKNTYRLCIRE
jgi:hypothetical protein